MLATEVGYQVWEYPIFTSFDGPAAGYVSAIVPLTAEERQRWLVADDRDLSYFAPDHEAGNLLSYRAITDLPAAADRFSRVGQHNITEQSILPGGNLFIWSLATWSLTNDETRTGTVSRTEESEGLGFPLWDIGDIGLSGSYESGFETVDTTARSEVDVVDLKVEMNGIPLLDYRYSVTPVVSWDPSGAVVLDFAVEFRNPGFFQDTYGTLSDPAVSLPHLWDVEKGLTENTERRLETRDIELVPADPQPGDQVVLSARVHNYSLVATPGAVNVKLYDGEPRFGRLIASRDTAGPIPAREDAIVSDLEWTVPSSAEYLKYARLWMVIEPVGGYGQIHTENDAEWRPVSSAYVPEPGFGANAVAALLTLALLRRRAERRA